MQNINHPVEIKHFLVKNNFAVIDTYEPQYIKYQVILQ